MCASDLDCPGPQVCIFGNVSWTGSTESSCGCSPWFGWTGMPACDEIAASGWVIAGTYAVLATAAAAALLAGAAMLGTRAARRQSCLRVNAGSVTFALAMLALSCAVGWYICALLNVSRPASNTELAVDAREGEQKYPAFYVAERVFTVMSLLFSTACSLNVSLMWIKVVSFSRAIDGAMLGHLNHCRRVVYATEFVHACTLIPCFVLGVLEYVVYITMPVYIFIIVVYTYAQRKLVGLLACYQHTAPEGSQQAWCKSQIRRVRHTAIQVTVGIAVTLVFAVVYASLFLQPNGWQEYSGPSDQLGVVQWVYLVVPAGLLWVNLAVLHYTFETLGQSTPPASVKSRSSSVEKLDRQAPRATGGDDSECVEHSPGSQVDCGDSPPKTRPGSGLMDMEHLEIGIG